jgi:hypothetical protein
MRTVRYCVVVTVLIAAGVGVVTYSAPEDPAAARVGQELRGIREALEQLVVLQQVSERQRETELVLMQIDLAVRRIAPLEREVAGAKEELRAAEENLQALDRMEEQHEAYLQQQIREGTDTPRSETRMMLESIERTRTGREETMEDTGLRIQLLENELAAKRRRIEILDDRLLDLLESE